jgi:hypothetical protein
VRLHSRPGNDLTKRFPLIVEAMAKLRPRSCIIDGEAVACGDDGIACFELIRRWDTDENVFMWAFDLIELNGDDLRLDPLAVRKAALVNVLARAAPGVRFNEHLEEDGPIVFNHACELGLEGIVSKRMDSRYRSGRSPFRSDGSCRNPVRPPTEAAKRKAPAVHPGRGFFCCGVHKSAFGTQQRYVSAELTAAIGGAADLK